MSPSLPPTHPMHSKRERESKENKKKKKEAKRETYIVYIWVCIETHFNKILDFTAQKTRTVNQFIVRICED